MALVTAPNPALGDVQERSEPEPVQVPGVPAPVEAAVEAASAAEEVLTETAEVAYISSVTVRAFRPSSLTAWVTVMKVVPQAATPLGEAAAELRGAAATSVVVSEALLGLEVAPPRVEAAALFPSRATAVKLEKP